MGAPGTPLCGGEHDGRVWRDWRPSRAPRTRPAPPCTTGPRAPREVPRGFLSSRAPAAEREDLGAFWSPAAFVLDWGSEHGTALGL